MNKTTLWKVTCMEGSFPGMWQRWYKNQCVAVGWPNYKLAESAKGWTAARNAIKKMEVGDYVVVALQGNRVGRLGQITGKAIEDHQWNPLVPAGPGMERGEMGRRILVRWDLTVGPESPDLVVKLGSRKLSSGELRPTASRVTSMTLSQLKAEMNDPTNWVNLLGFRYEKALSDYIANYPHRLEDGLLPHPNKKIRECAMSDGTRIDVLLIDGEDVPVIVECKQHAPTAKDVGQLSAYMKHIAIEAREPRTRGILVHGGASKLSAAVIAAASKAGIEVVSYSLDVNFKPSAEVRRPR